MKRPRRPRSGQGNLRVLTSEQESELAGGPSWLLESKKVNDPDEVVFFDGVAERDEAWAIHGERIMTEWEVPFRRPRMWWIERGEWPGSAASELVELVRGGELTPRERGALGGHLTPSTARELAAVPELWEDRQLRDVVLKFEDLLVGLTPKGRDAFLDSLSREKRNLPERLHRTGGGA